MSFFYRFFFLFLLFLSQSVYSQFTSPYINLPENNIGYVDSCARFWFKAYDTLRGGYYTNIDRKGSVITSWGTNKNMISQSRDAYGFVRAFMLTGKDEYLTYARRAVDFMEKNAWDKTSGGWYNELDITGKPTRSADNKTAFNQHYAVLGPLALFEATQDTTVWNTVKRSVDYIESRLWDSRPEKFGYYDYTSAGGTQPAGKSFNATVDAVTTHILQLYLMTRDTTYRTRLIQLCRNMIDRLAASVSQQKIGFAELYDSEWNPNNAETMTIMGHVLKTAWCLARIYALIPDSSYLKQAEMLTQSVLQKGYDHTYGGPYKDYNRTTGEMLMWGKADTAKAWWQMEQAVMAGMYLYELKKKSEYAVMADRTLNFYMNYFVDHTYGEVYENRTKTGGQIWDDNKGSGGKAGYHSTELGYYVYLYSNLLLKYSTAALWYNFAPENRMRKISLTPVSLPQDRTLRIRRVLLNDSAYTAFDQISRTLTLPAGVGGKFAVTFEPWGICSVTENFIPKNIALVENFPNPANPSTTIRFTIPRFSRATVTIYDALGRETSRLVDEEFQSGSYEIRWNASSVSSGVYFCRLTGDRFTAVRKISVMK